jgi:hypothetical protein
MRKLSRGALLLLFLVFVTRANAQTVVSNMPEREVITQTGTVQSIKPPLTLSPVTRGKATVTANFSPAPSFRLHFQVLQPTTAEWTLQIFNPDDPARALWTLSSKGFQDTDFWSSQIFGDKATIVLTTAEDPSRLQIIVDKFINFFPQTEDYSMISKALIKIESADSTIREWGKAVAKLNVVRDETLLPFKCTGFLVAPDLLMTNRHCSESGTEAKSTYALFDYDKFGLDLNSLPQPKVKEVVLSSCDLDFALLRLDRSIPYFPGDDRKPLHINPLIPISAGQGLIIVQHSEGQPKQVSQTNCGAKIPQIIGNSSTATDFGHSCDTSPASSGSPVQFYGPGPATNQGQVIGIHHLGFRTDAVQAASPEKINRAVKMDLIVEYIRRHKPEILKELGLK